MNIAVSGGMGSGKSFVASTLAELLGANIVSADILCRELLQLGNPGYLRLRECLGDTYFSIDGEIDRAALRKSIFSDSGLRADVDKILHPLVRQKLLDCAAGATRQNVDLVVEVPLLFEKGWQEDFDCTLVVYADVDICVSRIVARDHVSREDALKSISTQMPQSEKCKLGDWVVDNSGSFEETRVALRRIVGEISDSPCLSRVKSE
ncbi:dephospho-CoA kinase [Desulfocapsa sulfexigens]|nr:dephospho-CoA kinase [Desulfocapsa sulfexigens]